MVNIALIDLEKSDLDFNSCKGLFKILFRMSLTQMQHLDSMNKIMNDIINSVLSLKKDE